MSKFEPRHYTLNIEQVSDHLEVTIPELDVTVETAPGATSQDDAFEAAHAAIEQAMLKRDAPRTPAPVVADRA